MWVHVAGTVWRTTSPARRPLVIGWYGGACPTSASPGRTPTSRRTSSARRAAPPPLGARRTARPCSSCSHSQVSPKRLSTFLHRGRGVFASGLLNWHKISSQNLVLCMDQAGPDGLQPIRRLWTRPDISCGTSIPLISTHADSQVVYCAGKLTIRQSDRRGFRKHAFVGSVINVSLLPICHPVGLKAGSPQWSLVGLDSWSGGDRTHLIFYGEYPRNLHDLCPACPLSSSGTAWFTVQMATVPGTSSAILSSPEWRCVFFSGDCLSGIGRQHK